MDNNLDNNILLDGVSIILCTYNGKKFLSETLKYITNQVLFIKCEIILIDNASKDGTKDFADNWWYAHGIKSGIDYQSFIQSKPGKSYAQELGYEQAQYSYLLICDDDNWLNPNYVQLGYEIMQSNLEIGALGGFGEAVFENYEPDWFQKHKSSYAVGKQSTAVGDITKVEGTLYGAGMMLRKSHWLELKKLGFEHLLSCRKGNALSSGGDTEYCYALRLLGYKIWYDDRLIFKHFMAEGRLNLRYLSRLRNAMVYSNFVINTYRLVLSGKKPSQKEQLKIKLNYMFIKRVCYFFIGNYSQKETAKSYFKGVKLLICSYQERLAHYNFIISWVSNKQ